MPKYYARVCWNSKGWVKPSDDVRKYEKLTYNAEDGFGHEEWLFSLVWLIDGYHYSFLQGINANRTRFDGQTIDVILWAIEPERKRVYVGEITNCEVLTKDQSRQAFIAHKQSGWLEHMREDVRSIKGSVEKLSTDGIFNIRFRPSNAILFDIPRVAKPDDRISRLKRYSPLVAADTDDPAANTAYISGRRGLTTLPQLGMGVRSSSKGGTMQQSHILLQKALMSRLQKRYGIESVVREQDWVDLSVSASKRKLLVELKTHASVRRCIREALGQILEYAYLRPKSDGEEYELFIVGPGVIDPETRAYLELLNQRFSIPISYCQFSLDDELPSSFQ